MFDLTISVEIIKGGFVLHYPTKIAGEEDSWGMTREVFTSSRKLQHKIRDVLNDVSLVKDDGKDAE